MPYLISLCGLSTKDQNLVEIVITRVPNPRHAFQVVKPGFPGRVDMAIVDCDNPLGTQQFAELRSRNPSIIGIYLSDHGLVGDTRHRIERRSLLLRVQRVLDDVVSSELGSESARAVPAPGRNEPAPGVAATRKEAAFSASSPGSLLAATQMLPLRALVVDDSATVREQLRGALERAGLSSDSAEHADAALALLQSQRYDLIFLDVVMPGIDGYELCRKIKQNAYTRGLPVLMLTSRSSPFDRARGALAGCDSYLVKPVTWEAFFQALDRTLSKHFRNDREGLARRGYRFAGSH